MLPASMPGPSPNSLQMRLKSVSNLDSASSTLTTPSHSPDLPQTSQIMLNNDCCRGLENGKGQLWTIGGCNNVTVLFIQGTAQESKVINLVTPLQGRTQ